VRALIQRVSGAWVEVEGSEISRISSGLLVLLGVSKHDSIEDARYLVNKITNLRVFSDENDKFNCSALDVGAEFLVVSQFTLYADTRRGRRPSFTQAASPDFAKRLYLETVQLFKESGLTVKVGQFQEHMMVHIDNDGPVTLAIDSDDRFNARRC